MADVGGAARQRRSLKSDSSAFRDAGKAWPVQGTRYWAAPRIEIRWVNYVFKAKDEQIIRTYRAVEVTQPGKREVVERTTVERSFGQVSGSRSNGVSQQFWLSAGLSGTGQEKQETPKKL